MIGIFIIAIIGMLISIAGLNENFSVGSNVISSLLFIIIIIAAVNNKPKAIDVYRGKTQLVLDYNTDGTYDSIVVWKGNT